MIANQRKQSKTRKSIKLTLGALALSCSLFAGNASAIFGAGDTVIEIGPNLVQGILNQINTYTQKIADGAEYVENKTRWLKQLNYVKQQLITMQSMLTSIGMPQSEDMVEVAPDYLVKERCQAGSGGFSLTSLLGKVFKVDPNGDLQQQQAQICANIRYAQNSKYNYTIRFLKKTLPQLQTQLDGLNERRKSSNDQGLVQTVDSDSSRLANDLSVKFQIWQSQMNSYDTYIASMQENQRILTSNALSGQTTIIGSFVKSAVLAGALSVK